MKNLALALFVTLSLSSGSRAETADVKVKGVNTNQDTSIIIKKGSTTANECTHYEIVEGRDEITGDPNFAREGAQVSWKNACKEWKTSMREMNKGNQMITLNCNSPTQEKSGDMTTYKSTGTYKMKVLMTEKK